MSERTLTDVHVCMCSDLLLRLSEKANRANTRSVEISGMALEQELQRYVERHESCRAAAYARGRSDERAEHKCKLPESRGHVAGCHCRPRFVHVPECLPRKRSGLACDHLHKQNNDPRCALSDSINEALNSDGGAKERFISAMNYLVGWMYEDHNTDKGVRVILPNFCQKNVCAAIEAFADVLSMVPDDDGGPPDNPEMVRASLKARIDCGGCALNSGDGGYRP
jgi:hypothetical protein